MSKLNIYFFGSNSSFVSAIFLLNLIKNVKHNKNLKIESIINTEAIIRSNESKSIYNFKNIVKHLIFFFFNKKIYNIFKIIYAETNKKNIYLLAKDNHIEYQQFNKLKKIKKNSFLINVGGLKIFKKNFLNKFNVCINYHNAELPDFRGANANSFSIFYNKTHTFFSFHYLNEKIDRGYVFFKRKIKISKKIKHHLYYEYLKIKLAAKNVNNILIEALKKKKLKNIKIKKGKYYSIKYYKNFFNKIYLFKQNEIQKYINVFGGFYYNNLFVTKIKKAKKGILLKDNKIRIIHVKNFPIFIYRILIFFKIISN